MRLMNIFFSLSTLFVSIGLGLFYAYFYQYDTSFLFNEFPAEDLELLRYIPPYSDSYLERKGITKKDISVLCVHGAFSSARSWQMKDHGKLLPGEENSFLRKFSTEHTYPSYALSFRYHGMSVPGGKKALEELHAEKSGGKSGLKSAWRDPLMQSALNRTLSLADQLTVPFSLPKNGWAATYLAPLLSNVKVPVSIARRFNRVGDYVNDLHSVIHQRIAPADPNRLVLVCGSTGSFVCMKYLEKYGANREMMSKIAGVVLLSPTPQESLSSIINTVFISRMDWSQIARTVLTWDATPVVQNFTDARHYFLSQYMKDQTAQRIYDRTINPESLSSIYDMAVSRQVDLTVVRDNLKQGLPENKKLPIMILYSDADVLGSEKIYSGVVRSMKNALGDVADIKSEQFLASVDVSHWMQFGEGWKATHNFIVRFLRSLAPPKSLEAE